MADTVDKRVLASRRRLQAALATLILDQGYDTTTVRDITRAAGIGYATFYRHYSDKDDLLLALLDDVIADVRRLLPAAGDSLAEEGRVVFEHAAAHHQLYRILLRGDGTAAIVARIETEIADDVVRRLAAVAAPTPAVPLPVLGRHVAAAILALVHWWLENDQPFPPARMGEMYAAMIVEPALALAQNSDNRR